MLGKLEKGNNEKFKDQEFVVNKVLKGHNNKLEGVAHICPPGIGCGFSCRALVFNTKGPKFKSLHHQLLLNFYHFYNRSLCGFLYSHALVDGSKNEKFRL